MSESLKIFTIKKPVVELLPADKGYVVIIRDYGSGEVEI